LSPPAALPAPRLARAIRRRREHREQLKAGPHASPPRVPQVAKSRALVRRWGTPATSAPRSPRCGRRPARSRETGTSRLVLGRLRKRYWDQVGTK
jgi:hypothetical protein